MLRVAEVFLHNPLLHLFSDPLRHWEHARNPLSQAPMVVFDPPLYQMWLSLVQKWSLDVPELIAAYAAVLSVATPWIWYRYFRETLDSRTLALAGWAVVCWLPSWAGIYSYFMMETLFLPLLGASLWQTMRAARKGTTSSFAAMVFLWTLASLTRGIAIPLAGIAGLWVWLRHRHRIQAAACAILIVAVLMGPFAYRNYKLVGLWATIGPAEMNQILVESGKKSIVMRLHRGDDHWTYEFGSPSVHAKQFQPLTDWSPEHDGRIEIDIDLQKGAEDWRKAAQAVHLEGIDRLRMRAENFLLVMAGISWPDNNAEYPVARMSIASRWIWLPLLLLVAGVGAVRWRTSLANPLLPLLILTWLAVQSISLVSYNEGRYRKPFEGLLIAYALVLIDQSRRRPGVVGQ